MNILDIFRAGRCRRWHCEPVMADTDDRLDAHQGRVARLALALFPGDQALLVAALIHDDGESVTGDIPAGVKMRLSKVALDEIEKMEADGIRRLWHSPYIRAFIVPDAVMDDRLRLCDKLDAIMWVAHHQPRLWSEGRWPLARLNVLKLAEETGVADEIDWLLREIAPE